MSLFRVPYPCTGENVSSVCANSCLKRSAKYLFEEENKHRFAKMEASSGQPLSPRALLELEDAQKPLFPLVDYAELPSISPETMKKILEDEIEFDAKTVHIVDCRHDFEYAGGHIKGALNIDVPEEIETFYAKNKETGKAVAVIFHCEFSSNRAPKLFRYLRNLDRKEHLQNYPDLAFPYVYLLHGGYKAFFEQFPRIDLPTPLGGADHVVGIHSMLFGSILLNLLKNCYVLQQLCHPKQHVKMKDPRFSEQLLQSRKNMKKSWSLRNGRMR